MAHALWKGTINFGLVSMPVELVVADQTHSIDLDMLDKRDQNPIKYKRYNAATHREVNWNNIVKGFKTESGEYVVLTDKDIKSANPKATQTIDIQNFVDVRDVNVAYFEKPYFIKPLKGGEKPYSLLYKTLMKTGKVGIATVVIRTKQHLAALISNDGMLMLELLRFSDELRSRKDIEINHPKVSSSELKMASELVASMTAEWDPKQYKNTYKQDIMKMIRYKIKHGKTYTPEVLEDESDLQSGKVVDLMPLLKKSLEGKKKKRRGVKRESSKVSS